MKGLLRTIIGGGASTVGWWLGDHLGLGVVGAFVLSMVAWGVGDVYAVRLYHEHF